MLISVNFPPTTLTVDDVAHTIVLVCIGGASTVLGLHLFYLLSPSLSSPHLLHPTSSARSTSPRILHPTSFVRPSLFLFVTQASIFFVSVLSTQPFSISIWCGVCTWCVLGLFRIFMSLLLGCVKQTKLVLHNL